MSRPRSRTASRRLHNWTRDLHLYIGLFISPFIIVYAVSAILFNHRWMPWGGEERAEASTRRQTIEMPQETDPIREAQAILAQLNIAGEIGFVSRQQEGRRIVIPVERPGVKWVVRVDTDSGLATVEKRKTGVWDALYFLHKMPGPHLVAIRGNWFYTKIWRVLADVSVYAILFVTATGIYLWIVLKAERKIGLVMLGTGVVSFVLLVLAVTR